MADVATKEPETLGARDLSHAFSYATEWLGVFVDEINALNVYPVPDGDTGTNMHLTMQAVRRQLGDENPQSMKGFAHALAYGSLLGARGNSGVILSQVLKGFGERARLHPRLGGPELAEALADGSESAYHAVMKPVEGTILSVVKSAARAAERAKAQAPLEVLRRAFEAAEEALERTPEQLPILKQAGVVDAGGKGLVRVLEGLLAYFSRLDLPLPPKVTGRAQKQFEERAYGFCTEFLLSHVSVPTRRIQELVQPYGDSLLVVGAEGYVKGHIHTEEPEQLLADVSRFGTMVRSKVEDMSEQHHEILADVEPEEAEAARSALVTVSSGYGVTRVFRSLGARVVGGGQADNPSVQDIADAVRSVGAHDVIVMPNNKNIIMAAERVQELVPDRHVEVLPTRTLGQGLAAAVLFQESEDLDTLLPAMRQAADASTTLEVTVASRSATIEDVAVSEGDYIGLADGELKVADEDADACLLALLEARADDYEIATLFYSAVLGKEHAEAVAERVRGAHPELGTSTRI
ncbi:MAG: DAK2 domain-containing protein [Deinococcales bacterium]